MSGRRQRRKRRRRKTTAALPSARTTQGAAGESIECTYENLERVMREGIFGPPAAAPAPRDFGPPFAATEEGELRAERSTFSLTMFADQSGDPYAPSSHVQRAPTIIWDPRETQPLLDLHGVAARGAASMDVEDAGGGEGGAGDEYARMAQLEAEEEDVEVGKVAHYYPSLEYALRRGRRGLGHPHARPPPLERNPPADPDAAAEDEDEEDFAVRMGFPRVTNYLSETQQRLLDEQNSANRTSLRRIISILRRYRPQRQEGAFRLLEFLRAFETECGLRTVHLAVAPNAEEPGLLDATIAYSLDQGGRFYVAIWWRGLARPEYGADPRARVQTPAKQYWSAASITPASRIDFCRYVCPCSLHATHDDAEGTATTTTTTQEGAEAL